MKLSFKKTVLTLLVFIVAAYFFACGYLFFRQNHILFPSPKTPLDKVYSFPVPFEEVWMDGDGAKLHGLYFHAKNPRGVIIMFHGNFEKAEEFGTAGEEFTSQGLDYFVPEFRGYGKSSGRITSEKQFLADADRIFEWVQQKYPENKIVLAGRSMGAVPAAYLGSKNKVRRVVLIAPFFNVAAMKDIRYPYLPDFLVRYQMRNDLWIQQIKSPVALIHGTLDKTIPYRHSERLAVLAQSPHRYFSVPGAGHSNLQDFPLYHKILRFLVNQENSN